MYEQKCPNCGGNKIIFENGHYKCAYCDAVFTDKTANKAAFKYAAQISQASEHLKIGNLDRAYELAKESSDVHPTDPRPYSIILLAITSKLTIYKLSDGKRKEAADMWSKLEQLNLIVQPLAAYSQNMSQKKINVLKENIIRDLLFISMGIVMLIAASFQYPEWTQLFIVLDIIYTCYYCWTSHFFDTVTMYQEEKRQSGHLHNPFLSPLQDGFFESMKDDF